MSVLKKKDCSAKPAWGLLQLIGVLVAWFYLFFYQDSLLRFSGAFFIPYYVWLLLIAVPIVIVQLKLGGSLHSGIVRIFSVHIPFLKGIGITVLLKLFILSIRLTVHATYSLYYAFESLQQPYVFASCNNKWNSPCCSSEMQVSSSPLGNISMKGICEKKKSTFPEQEYFSHSFLRVTPSIEETGEVVWYIAVCMLGCWALIFLVTCAGKRIYGWIALILSVPAVLIWLGLIAYGREELIHNHPEKVFYTSKIKQLTYVFDKSDNVTGPASVLNKPQLNPAWVTSLSSLMTSLSLWYGLLPTIGKCASGPKNRNTGTILAAVVVLLVAAVGPHFTANLLAPYMGALSAYLNIPLQELPGLGRHHPRLLSFVAFPMAFSHLSLKRGIAFVFHFAELLMLTIFVGLIVITVVDNCVEGISAKRRSLLKTQTTWMFIGSGIYCVCAFLLSLVEATQAGYYWTTFIDNWLDVLHFIVIILCMICFLVSYAKQPVPKAEKVIIGVWFFLASFGCAFVEVYTKVDILYLKITELKTNLMLLGKDYSFPGWIFAIGWLLAAVPIVAGLLIGMFHAFTPGMSCGQWCCGNGRSKKEDKTPFSPSLNDEEQVGYDGPNS